MEPFEAPQADRLDLVRKVVEGVGAGVSGTDALATFAQVARRYAQYCLQAARQLGLVTFKGDESGVQVTKDGKALLKTHWGSPEEQKVLRRVFTRSPQLRALSTTVLRTQEPTREEVAEELMSGEKVSLATAMRRASTLLAWRRFLLSQTFDVQLPLPLVGMDWPTEVAVPPPSAAHQVTPSPDESVGGDDSSGADESTEAPTDLASILLSPAVTNPLPDTVTLAEPPPSPDKSVSRGDSDSGDTPSPAGPVATAAATHAGEDANRSLGAIKDGDRAYLRRHIEQGSAILFTGAGFSICAKDGTGSHIPDGNGFAHELWTTCYGSEAFDNSSLQDIFEHAQRARSAELAKALATRFAVDPKSLSDWYRQWFSMPWARAYTLNVDNIEAAASRRFDLPRPIQPLSALHRPLGSSGSALNFVHLNGMASDGPSGVTFSHEQYLERIGQQDPAYAQLAAELLTRPFVFVGSPLDEILLWAHIQLRGQRATESENELRPKSFLVSPSLSRAKIDKLRRFNVLWVKATAEQFAREVLEPMSAAAVVGHARHESMRAADLADERNIVEIGSVIEEQGRRTEFLMGEEPTWADIRKARAIARDEDGPLLERLRGLAFEVPNTKRPVPISVVLGTAGSGKTTLLMKLALSLHVAASRVAWIGGTADVAPRGLTRYYRTAGQPPVLVIDDAGRYGRELIPTLLDLTKSDSLRLIVLSMRSHHEQLLDVPGAEPLSFEKHTIGSLTDGDIDRLLIALEREQRLGALLGFSVEKRRSIFREKAARQILVAMIEATSGERFESKIVAEWQTLQPAEQYVYAIVALGTAQSYPMTRDEIILACSGKTPELEAIRRLVKAHILVEVEGGARFRARHGVIAEKLVEELAQRGTHLERLIVGLCRALAIKTEPDALRNSRRRRVLTRLLNHDGLLRLLNDIEPARGVYAALQDHLNWDFHFWLQRGCLELEDGELPYAENFLRQAEALNKTDPLVETAVAHMELRRAIGNPQAPEAAARSAAAFETLRRLIAARGAKDSYPAHVFGSQALGWVHKAALTPKESRALIREAKEIAEAALVHHRHRVELKQLLYDVRRAELEPR